MQRTGTFPSFYLQNVTSTKYVDAKNELINKVHALGKYADNVVVA
jgi:hypothetical protein